MKATFEALHAIQCNSEGYHCHLVVEIVQFCHKNSCIDPVTTVIDKMIDPVSEKDLFYELGSVNGADKYT